MLDKCMVVRLAVIFSFLEIDALGQLYYLFFPRSYFLFDSSFCVLPTSTHWEISTTIIKGYVYLLALFSFVFIWSPYSRPFPEGFIIHEINSFHFLCFLQFCLLQTEGNLSFILQRLSSFTLYLIIFLWFKEISVLIEENLNGLR